MDLALNNLQRLICHKTQQTKPNKKTDADYFVFRRCWMLFYKSIYILGGRGVMITVVENEHGDSSLNLGRVFLHFL